MDNHSLRGALKAWIWALVALLGSLITPAGADDGGTRNLAGSGRFSSQVGTDALAISAGVTQAAVLSTAGTDPLLPLVDGVRSRIFLSSERIGLESDGTLVVQGILYGSGAEASTGLVDVTVTARSAVTLNSEGVIEAFGTSLGATSAPSGMNEVVDVSIGYLFGAVVLADGSVIAWSESSPPTLTTLSDVVEVDCGDRCGIALKADGTVVTWGDGPAVGLEPAGLTDVYSVHASLSGEAFAALKTDGTLVTWPTPGPLDGGNVVAADIGVQSTDQIVITEVNALPCGRLLPINSQRDSGSPHLIKVHSYSPVATYQWKLDGVDLAGETKPFLYIDSVDAADLGDYTVVMTNINGSTETAASNLSLNLEDQTIDFPAIADRAFGSPDFDLSATASSGLPVELSIQSGPATISGNTITMITAGTVVVRAAQAGNSQYDPAPFVDQTFEVTKIPATVTLSDLAYTYDGTPKAATVVTDPAGLNIIVTYNGDPTLPSGAGDYAAIATIDEVNYAGSSNGTLVIAPAAQLITFTAPADVVFGDAPGTLVASADSALTVDFEVVSGPASISGATITYNGGGDVTVRALQAGNSNFEPAIPVEHSFTVAAAPQTIDFPAVATQTFGSASFIPPVSASSSLPVPIIVLSGPAQISAGNIVTLTGAGTVTLRASQTGNPSWLPAATVDRTFIVEKQAQTIDFSALADRVFDSGDFNLTATASSGLPVDFSIIEGPATITGTTVTMTGAGSVTVRASQAGDDDFLAAENADRSFVAGYSLTITADAGGDASATPAQPVYAPGETISISMTETATHRFTGWSGDLEGTESPIDLLMDSNKTVNATFKQIWTLAVTSGEGGSVTVEPEKAEYLNGDVVTLTPVPDTGYELAEWQGDATGSEAPLELTISDHTSIIGQFVDVAPPEVSILSPTTGITNNQFVAMFGSVTDNHEIASLRWMRDGVDKGELSFAGGFFNVTGLVLHPGDNVFEVFALDTQGNERTSDVTIDWVPDRTLSLEDPPEVREGKIVTVPMSIESQGNVGGMTYIVSYDPIYLNSPEVLLAGPVAFGINQINTDTPGEVRITFALPATTLPAGLVDIGTVSFRARSVPFNLATQFGIDVIDVAGADGNQINFGTHTVGAEGRILQRNYTGDINTNDRLDTGDAFLMQRMLAGFDGIRTWDNPLNDLNTSGLVDSGDVIRVLRTVVGIDPQPAAGAGQRNARGPKNTTGPRASMVMNQNYGSPGDEITLQVRLDDVGYAPNGASFTLDYPTDALLLTDATAHTKGEIVPNGSLVLWNLAPTQNDYTNQSGSISFVASSSASWPDAEQGGVIAEFVFSVQAGATAQALWPIQLHGTEVPSEDGFDILTLADSETDFIGTPTTFDSWSAQFFTAAELTDQTISSPAADADRDGRDNLSEYAMGSDPTSPDVGNPTEAVIINGSAAIEFSLSLTAIDLAYEIEVSGGLEEWNANSDGTTVTEIDNVRRGKDGITDRITARDLEPLDSGERFLRVRFELVE